MRSRCLSRVILAERLVNKLAGRERADVIIDLCGVQACRLFLRLIVIPILRLGQRKRGFVEIVCDGVRFQGRIGKTHLYLRRDKQDLLQ